MSVFVLRMSDIVSRRQRTPWFWPDFVYNCFGEGREHNDTLKILHSFTHKESGGSEKSVTFEKSSSRVHMRFQPAFSCPR